MAQWWRQALGAGREPSADQEAAIVAPPSGRHSVNAGAGTGKTSTLALRALHLIEAGDVRADQIVVVTFTKKAAAEVGSRIADTIDRAIAAGAALPRDSRNVLCTTIHALAAEILREFAFDFGSPVPLRAVTDGEAHGIFHESFRALLDGRLAADTRAFPVAEINLDLLERDLGKLALRLKNHGIAPAAFEARALAQTDRFAGQMWGQLWTAGSGKNRGKPKAMEPKEPVSAEERCREAERERMNIRVVAALYDDFDQRLAERGAATYGDLMGTTTRWLSKRPELVTRLRARWRYLLLDESQDTSTLQLAFIETLFGRPGEPDAAGMMPVGDARQAIYGFNGADAGVMQRLTDGADAAHPLIVNRRSPQEIIDAAHAVLSSAGVIDGQTPLLAASAGSGGLSCVRVENFGEPGETIKEHVAREAVGIAGEVERLLRDPSTKPSDIAILVRRRTHAAAYVHALNERGIGAALDRRSGLFVADEIRDALAWMALVLDLRNRQAAVRILQSPLCGLNDSALIALAQRMDWLECLLRGDLGSEPDAATRDRLDTVRRLLTELLPSASLPLPAAIARILGHLPIAASYARMGEAIGAQAIVNLRSFELLGREFADERPAARLRDFVDDANRRILYDDDPQEAELELDGVRVLTIHQAKGLEWPFVFVACSTKNQYGNTEPSDRVVNYDLDSGAFALKNDVDGRETFRWLMLGCEHDAATGQREERGARKIAAECEQARVFYVAMTRAKRRVYITAPAPTAGTGAAPYLAAIRGWAESCEPGADLSFAVTPTPAAEPSTPRTHRTLRLLSEDVRVAAKPAGAIVRPRISFTAVSAFATCPRMARLRYRLRLPGLRENRPRYVGLEPAADVDIADAARLGSLAHRALELWARAAIESAPIAPALAFAGAASEFADATPAETARAEAGMERAIEALAGYELVGAETPFEVTFGDALVEGVIDLIARDPLGRLLVIDYKTGRTHDEHYGLQMALYCRAAAHRFPNERIEGAILRLAPEGATFAFASPMAPAELDRAIAAVGQFESDVANVGSWCDFCSYRASPCMAPLGQAG